MSDVLSLARAQAERFWSKVDKTGACWLWTAGKDKDGYGKFALTTGARPKQIHVRAHRLALAMKVGTWPPAGVVTIHHCDTPACCNPDHLCFGTQRENRYDCTRKGRNARGEKNPRAQLTEDIVRAIRAASDATGAALARRFGVGRQAVYAVRHGISWRHVP